MAKTQAFVFAALINEADIETIDAFHLFLGDNSEAFTINDTSETDADAGQDPFETPITYTFSDGSRAKVARKDDPSDDGDQPDQPLVAEVLEEVD
jgi:hypothetical protein